MASIKLLHQLCALISITGFVIRGLLMLADSPHLNARWVRIAPHVVDTTLLATGIALVVMTRQYPIEQAWLTAKLAALLAYIGLGIVALRYGRTRNTRAAAFAAAVAVFAYIVAVALSRTPTPVFLQG
jgi:uncharacterized membrane protein SirB2